MIRLVIEVRGIAMPKSPMEVVEKHVLSPKLHRVEGSPKGFPMDYNHEEIVGGRPLVAVRIVEGEQI